MSVDFYKYNELLDYASKYYQHKINGDLDNANENLSEFFLRANSESANPSVARMALQQASVDTRLDLEVEKKLNGLDRDTFKHKKHQILLTELELNRDERLITLENKIKTSYKDSFIKRFAIIHGLADNKLVGLISVKEITSRYAKRIAYKMFRKLYMR